MTAVHYHVREFGEIEGWWVVGHGFDMPLVGDSVYATRAAAEREAGRLNREMTELMGNAENHT